MWWYVFASFIFCILTSVYDIEWLSLCNADTTSLFPVRRCTAIPKLKKKTRKIKITERKTIRPMRNPNENYYLSELVCLSSFLLLNIPTLVWRCYCIPNTMNFKWWVNCCINGVVKFMKWTPLNKIFNIIDTHWPALP